MSQPRKHCVERVAFEKGYRVSAAGDVVTAPSGRPRKLHSNKWGYFQFSVTTPTGQGTCPVHRLQAYQKFGEQIYTIGLEVRHHNNNRQDNSVGNILLGTKSDNAMDKPKATRVRVATNANKRFDALEVRRFYETCRSWKAIMHRFGIKSKSTVHRLINPPLPSSYQSVEGVVFQ